MSVSPPVEDNYRPPESADGTLVVIVCRAKHLPNRRKLDKQSPYATLRIGTTAHRTPSHFRAGQTPEWTHEVRFQLSRERKPILKLDVLDETKNDPTPVGNAEIDCSVIFANPENRQNGKYIYDQWYNLTLHGKRAGMVFLEMTFYPSAPILPPKVPEQAHEEHIQEEPFIRSNKAPAQAQLFQDLNSSPPPSARPSLSTEVFVNSENSQSSFKAVSAKLYNSYSGKNSYSSKNSNSKSSGSQQPQDLRSAPESDPHDVFVTEEPELHGAKKYAQKLAKLKSKLQSKEPITSMWQHESSPGISASSSPTKLFNFSKQRSVSPISAYDGDINNLDQLQRDISVDSPGEYHVDEIDYGPPPPPRQSRSESPLPPPPPDHQRSSQRDRTSPTRKPPPGRAASPQMPAAIPFSADSIGEEPHYQFQESVSPLNFGSSTLSSVNPHAINPNEIDPKYYAPTPGEHQNLQTKLHGNVPHTGRVNTDWRTEETGYLGNGKFSPSVFQRAVQRDFDEMSYQEQLEAKPQVPPKVPQGLTEQEYYVLERDSYLRDLNGRRA